MNKYIEIAMESKLKRLFTFLSDNREFNKEVQERFYKRILLPYANRKERIVSLLYHVANTQSQPKIDKLATFYKTVIQDNKSLNSFEDFVRKTNPKNDRIDFKNLYLGMENQPGWGKKTAALFVKSIYHLHNGAYSESLKIWDDVPREITNTDLFYLPVDTVITAVFDKLDNSKKWDFDGVNKILQNRYNGSEIEIWDDLWFWGFISQKVEGSERKFEWNENKYWALHETVKNKEIIESIKKKVDEYLDVFH